jgi:hypothetical protein
MFWQGEVASGVGEYWSANWVATDTILRMDVATILRLLDFNPSGLNAGLRAIDMEIGCEGSQCVLL